MAVKKIKHKNRAHALLSASGAHRWLNCTPSAVLESKKPREASKYAEEGTLAHEFAELALRLQLNRVTRSDYSHQIKSLQAHELYSSEMETYATDYALHVCELAGLDPQVAIETRVDFSHIVPDGFGTADAIIITSANLRVVDFKYGAGVAVAAEKNPQLLLYALGAISKFSILYDFTDIHLDIFQPRISNYSSHSLSASELIEWGETVKPLAALAIAGKGEQQAGEWCKFCAAGATCRKRAEENLKVARLEFGLTELADSELLDIYNKRTEIRDWLNAVEGHLLTSALGGKHWPGFKLVEGRSNRKWLNESKVREVFAARGFSTDDYLKKTLVGIPQAEKLLGKDTVSQLVYRPQGAPTLVVDSDKRAEFNSAEVDFNVL